METLTRREDGTFTLTINRAHFIVSIEQLKELRDEIDKAIGLGEQGNIV